MNMVSALRLQHLGQCGAPNNLVYISPLFKNCHHGLHPPGLDIARLGLPCLLRILYLANVFPCDPSSLRVLVVGQKGSVSSGATTARADIEGAANRPKGGCGLHGWVACSTSRTRIMRLSRCGQKVECGRRKFGAAHADSTANHNTAAGGFGPNDILAGLTFSLFPITLRSKS
jgi:hypothetical protein